MTPMAWKTPVLMTRLPLRGPRMFGDCIGPWVATVRIMTFMLIKASVDALANYSSRLVMRCIYEIDIAYHGNVSV